MRSRPLKHLPGTIFSPSLSKSGSQRCIGCNKFVSGTKMLDLACATLGEDSMKLILTPEAAATIGRILRYNCFECGRDTYYIQRDPGITPFILQCRALGDDSPCKGGMVRTEVFGKGDPKAPKPDREFYRRVGRDLETISPADRELAARGMLDERALKEVLVKLA